MSYFTRIGSLFRQPALEREFDEEILFHLQTRTAQNRDRGMAAYSELQEKELEAEKAGYEAIKHQEFVGTGYFDAVTEIATGGQSSTLGMKGSTEKEQF